MLIKEAILPIEIERIKTFLNTMELSYEDDIDYTVYIEEGKKIIATISCSSYIIKAFAVDQKYQGMNIANTLISHIINYFRQNNIYYYQVFTKPENIDVFLNFNFNLIASSKHVSLLECKNYTINEALNEIKNSLSLKTNDIAAIVVNTNPTTKGHLYLIEKVASKHKEVIVFILEEDRSTFSFQDRFFILNENTKHLLNVHVIPSTKYIISRSTFPTYFLKVDADEVNIQAELDAIIFKQYFMPILGIKKRYVGEETDLVTNKYNQKLKEVLGNNLEVIPRKDIDNTIISASLVRKLLKENQITEAYKYLPDKTILFLESPRGKELIRRLQAGEKSG